MVDAIGLAFQILLVSEMHKENELMLKGKSTGLDRVCGKCQQPRAF